VAEITAAAVKALRDQTGAGMMDCKRVLQQADGDVKRAVELLRERGLARAGKREGRVTSDGLIAIALDGGVGGMIELGCETDFVARTDEFGALADALASAVVADGSLEGVEALIQGEIEGEKVADKLTATAAKLGENAVLKRTARLEVQGPGIAGGYVHAGGKLGVLVGLRTSVSGPAVEGLAKDLAMHVAAADPSPLAVDRDGISPELLETERKIYRRQAEQEGKPEKVIDRIVEGKLGKFTAEVCLLEQAFVKDPDRSVGDLLRDVAKEVGAEIEVSGFRRFKLGEASEA
jgi:elongation factor Ts